MVDRIKCEQRPTDFWHELLVKHSQQHLIESINLAELFSGRKTVLTDKPISGVPAKSPTTLSNVSDRKLGKMHCVCIALLVAMLTRNSQKYLLPILTCYAKLDRLGDALTTLKKLKDSGDIEGWESGLLHLQYISSPEALYRVALGTYDLSLAKALAERTQLDPKEYLAELASLMSLTATFEPKSPSFGKTISSISTNPVDPAGPLTTIASSTIPTFSTTTNFVNVLTHEQKVSFQKAQIDIILGRIELAIRNLYESGKLLLCLCLAILSTAFDRCH
ncbi:unnamed protein product [Protopolystoma xenopodis]|uniref:ELP1 alpha-solenoid domain-containing protein n=1 Tax=Protopolystoma xenopodis TaxID=117903 RepID=A0A3S5AXH5_9PLAT|nr:unnamed protein product [Protopolystoma xenopodis]